MTAYLRANTNIYCFVDTPCFAACVPWLRVTPDAGLIVPQYPTVTLAGGVPCICSAFSVENAQLTSQTRLQGTSPGGSPFTQVVLQGTAGSTRYIDAYYTSPYLGGTCLISYYISSGDSILGTEVTSGSFTLWWIIVVVVAMCALFGICICIRHKRGAPSTAGTTVYRPNQAAASPPAATYAYTTSPGGNVPMASAVPVAQGTAVPVAQGPYSSQGVPVAQGSAVPVAQGSTVPVAQGTAVPVAQGTAVPVAVGSQAPGVPHAHEVAIV